ncbi:hypothetical protein K461DRAFT_283415 [Myriangium duriaei CBS 260.36]|uniref:Pentacotripeptide-repeat region of PRORP domain-containing protein n=1 Tax=Myriangium duriaei CBS 260.36 TaxID=1168546 RepID=A0A9P4MBQ1_9PEZI|nr:hypothetical protein K461DRAFT_283415 [Myriangium duriaei CBS 260.36]
MLEKELTLEQKRHLRMELLWLKDPAKLAQTVRRILEKGELQKAINLVRLASTSENKPIVAWNAILSYVSEQRDYKSAFKLYNEMKKRAQHPDSYTVVHFLRGLARQPVSPEQVRLALHLHESLEAENSKVERSIIHTNAAMQVCINAQDYDSMWTLVSKLPDQGREAADQVTFDTILTSLRKDVESKARSDTDYDDKLTKCIDDGRKVWQDVIRRSKKGFLKLDESLICSYLRLLLLRPSQSISLEILSIIEDTIGIPTRPQPAKHADASQTQSLNDVPDRKRNMRTTAAVSRPSKFILSIILEAYLELPRNRSTNIPPMQYYWKALTENYSVRPDLENYHSLLRLCMLQHNSEWASEIITEMATSNKHSPRDSQGIAPGRTAYILALTACVREANAIRSGKARILERAHDIFDGMVQNLRPVPPRPVAKFLECAVVVHSPSQVYATLRKTMPVLDGLLHSNDKYTKSSSTVNRADSFKEDLTALVALTTEVVNTLRSAGVEDAWGGQQSFEDVKTWSDQLQRWSQDHGTKQVRPTEVTYLKSFANALRSRRREEHWKRVEQGVQKRAEKAGEQQGGRRRRHGRGM